MNRANDRLVCGVDDLESPAVDGFNELVVNEAREGYMLDNQVQSSEGVGVSIASLTLTGLLAVRTRPSEGF